MADSGDRVSIMTCSGEMSFVNVVAPVSDEAHHLVLLVECSPRMAQLQDELEALVETTLFRSRAESHTVIAFAEEAQVCNFSDAGEVTHNHCVYDRFCTTRCELPRMQGRPNFKKALIKLLHVMDEVALPTIYGLIVRERDRPWVERYKIGAPGRILTIGRQSGVIANGAHHIYLDKPTERATRCFVDSLTTITHLRRTVNRNGRKIPLRYWLREDDTLRAVMAYKDVPEELECETGCDLRDYTAQLKDMCDVPSAVGALVHIHAWLNNIAQWYFIAHQDHMLERDMLQSMLNVLSLVACQQPRVIDDGTALARQVWHLLVRITEEASAMRFNMWRRTDEPVGRTFIGKNCIGMAAYYAIESQWKIFFHYTPPPLPRDIDEMLACRCLGK